MALPYKRIPAGIAGFTSPTGKLPASQLSHVDGSGDFQLQAARSLRALASSASGADLIVASVGDYRSYDEQVALFKSRYVHGRNFDNTDRFWHSGTNGGDDQWWKLVRGAPAAEPGTSNHGLGLANDFALNLNGQIVTLDTKVNGLSLWDWLNLYGKAFGWSWGETSSERWHWVYIEGDVIPKAVLDYEATVKVIDYFAPWVGWDPRKLKAAGITGVSRYIAGDFTSSKEISKAEYAALLAAGLTVTLNWETTGHAYVGGYQLGLQHGQKARAQARALGHPDHRHIFQSEADTDIPVGNYPILADYQRGFNDGGGCGLQSAYSTAGAIDFLFSHFLIQPGWQSMSRAYTNNGYDSGTAAMIQRISHSFPSIDPSLYDENDIVNGRTDWGQVPTPQGVDDMSAADVAAINAHTDAQIKALTDLVNTIDDKTASFPVLPGPTGTSENRFALMVRDTRTIIGQVQKSLVDLTATVVALEAHLTQQDTAATAQTKVITDGVQTIVDEIDGLTPGGGGSVDWSKVTGHQPSQGDITFTTS